MIKFLSDLSLYILPFIICTILIWAMVKKVPSYEVFVDGAKEGFDVAIKIIPYLIAIMVCCGMLRASGAIEIFEKLFKPLFDLTKVPIETSMIILTRSLSGSATLGVLADIIDKTGVNSYATKLAAVITGSSETTFYVAAVYFGAVGIKKFKYAIMVGILADIVGLFAAIVICRFFFLP